LVWSALELTHGYWIDIHPTALILVFLAVEAAVLVVPIADCDAYGAIPTFSGHWLAVFPAHFMFSSIIIARTCTIASSWAIVIVAFTLLLTQDVFSSIDVLATDIRELLTHRVAFVFSIGIPSRIAFHSAPHILTSSNVVPAKLAELIPVVLARVSRILLPVLGREHFN
jgi:hypothetical protein